MFTLAVDVYSDDWIIELWGSLLVRCPKCRHFWRMLWVTDDGYKCAYCTLNKEDNNA